MSPPNPRGELADWCLTVIRFFASKGAFDPEWQQSLERSIEGARRSGTVRGLRSAQRDLMSLVRRIEPADKAELDALLSPNTSTIEDEVSVAIAQVLARGFAETDEEYRLVHERAEEIWQDPARQGELDALNEALAGSHGKTLRSED